MADARLRSVCNDMAWPIMATALFVLRNPNPSTICCYTASTAVRFGSRSSGCEDGYLCCRWTKTAPLNGGFRQGREWVKSPGPCLIPSLRWWSGVSGTKGTSGFSGQRAVYRLVDRIREKLQPWSSAGLVANRQDA
jgi:hypothetical protein